MLSRGAAYDRLTVVRASTAEHVPLRLVASIFPKEVPEEHAPIDCESGIGITKL